MGEVSQRPHDDACHEDDATHLLQVLLAFLPGVSAYSFPGREAVGWQLHDERRVLALDDEAGEYAAQYDGKQDADEIERHHDERAILQGEEGSYHHDVDRQTRRTAHQRQDEHGDESRAMALDGACRHDGWHIAAKAHDEWDERLAVKSHLVHQLVHDEGSTCHIARVLHVGDEEVEDENLRQEDDDGSHASDDSIDEHVFHWSVGHAGADDCSQPSHSVLNPSLRHLAQDEGG